MRCSRFGNRRHEVTAHGWDDAKQKGWMRFRCMHCAYEYKMWMYTKVYVTRMVDGKPKRRKQPYSRTMLEAMAKWWRAGNGGTTVSSCKGCLPKRPK